MRFAPMKQNPRGIAAALLMTVPAVASAATDIAMHRDPGCGYCENWVAQVFPRHGRACGREPDSAISVGAGNGR